MKALLAAPVARFLDALDIDAGAFKSSRSIFKALAAASPAPPLHELVIRQGFWLRG